MRARHEAAHLGIEPVEEPVDLPEEQRAVFGGLDPEASGCRDQRERRARPMSETTRRAIALTSSVFAWKCRSSRTSTINRSAWAALSATSSFRSIGSGTKIGTLVRNLLEHRDPLRPAAIEDLEVLLGQSLDDMTIGVDDDHVDLHQLRPRAEDRWTAAVSRQQRERDRETTCWHRSLMTMRRPACGHRIQGVSSTLAPFDVSIFVVFGFPPPERTKVIVYLRRQAVGDDLEIGLEAGRVHRLQPHPAVRLGDLVERLFAESAKAGNSTSSR